jgi:elongation factor Tu
MEVFAFNDLLEPGPPARVLARVHFLNTSEGGRASPVSGVYRPNHNFGAPDGRQFYIGQVELPNGLRLLPGDTYDLYITFLNGPHLTKHLQVGRCWRIQEGARHVATAEVLVLLSEP